MNAMITDALATGAAVFTLVLKTQAAVMEVIITAQNLKNIHLSSTEEQERKPVS